MATLPRDHWAGFMDGSIITAPVRVTGNKLKVSVDGGTSGIQVGIVGDADKTVGNCDPIKGKVVDFEVTWKGSSDINMLNGAVSIEFKIPADATAFAFSI